MFDLLGGRPRPRIVHENQAHENQVREDQVALGNQFPAQRDAADSRPLSARVSTGLPPSVARVEARTRLSAELLAAILAVDGRSRATLDDMERADALADVLIARRRQRVGRHRPELARTGRHG